MNSNFLRIRISNPYFSFGIFLVAILSGIAFSFLANDWLWFSRFGAIASIGGIFASFRRWDDDLEPPQYQFSRNEYDDPVEVPESDEKTQRDIKKIVQNNKTHNIGIICIVISSIIWGFGDLVATFI